MSDSSAKRWYLLQCKPRQDQRALEHLERQGYRCLQALHSIESLHKGQLRVLDEPLFPGYLFIHLDKVEDNWLPIRSTRGVTRIVAFGGRPTAVPEEVIDRLNRPQAASIIPALLPGDSVRIDEPGLRQIDAIFLARDGDERVVLLLKLLQRDALVKVPLSRVSITEK